MKLSKVFAAAAITCMAAGAMAQDMASKFYGELGYTALNYKESGGTTFSPSALRGIVGMDFSESLAVEGMFGFGVSDSTTNLTNVPGIVPITLKLESMSGVYLKGKFKATAQLELFGRLGFSNIKVGVSAAANGNSFNASDSGGDVSYGAGLSYAFSPKTAATLDYMSYYNKEGVSIDGLTFGLSYKF